MPTKPFVDDMFSTGFTVFERECPEPISVTLEPFDIKLSYYIQHEFGPGCYLHYMRLEHTRLHRGVDIIINSPLSRDNFTLLNILRYMEFFSENNCMHISSGTTLQHWLDMDSYFCYKCYLLRMGRFINDTFYGIYRVELALRDTMWGIELLHVTRFNKSKIITERDFR